MTFGQLYNGRTMLFQHKPSLFQFSFLLPICGEQDFFILQQSRSLEIVLTPRQILELSLAISCLTSRSYALQGHNTIYYIYIYYMDFLKYE